MTLSDDAWKASYDRWKLASPDDEDTRGLQYCPHDEIDIDWNGTAHCEACFETWRATPAEIAHQREQQANYDKWCRQQERREFWRNLTYPIRIRVHRLLSHIWPRKACAVLDDNEIPF